MIARVFFALVLLFATGVSQQPAASPDLNLARFSQASRDYLRDSAELPMHMTFSLSATDAAGRVVKRRSGRVDYDFHGYKSGFTLRGMKSRDKSAGTLVGTTWLARLLLLPELEKIFRMQEMDSPDPAIVVADFTALAGCHPVWNNELYLPADMCGNFKVQLHKEDSSIQSFTFDLLGVPIQGGIDYLGPATINREYVVVDFQKAMLAGDPKPFIVPSHVTCTLETDKGKLIIHGEFTVKETKNK